MIRVSLLFRSVALLLSLFLPPVVFTQNILVNPLKFAWAGGLNSCQFCPIDLNLDGITDLLVFDRHGNRILTFINGGTPDSVDYIFSPEYAAKLPDLHDWVITADYNCDGKADLFTYSLGGIRVFRNISDTALKFKLVTNLLKSYYYTGYVGILVTPVDYPAIADIDSDGDLDILTFFGLGSYVEYHKNLSMEKFGNCDSLDYRLTDHCWGKFKESEGGNHITLNAACPYKIPGLVAPSDLLQVPDHFQTSLALKADVTGRNERHTGSTMLAIDLDGDSVKDLVLGDVDFPNLIALMNGGTKDSALMTSLDTLFPSYSRSIRLFSFPAASFLDVNNDGINDLLVSPFDPNLFISENIKSVWYFKNTGTNQIPHFEFETDRFLQQQMLDFGSNACPLLFDFNGDALQDLFVGNYGIYDSSWYSQAVLHSSYTAGITYFKNEGTVGSPLFRKVTDNLAGITALHLTAVFPALGDVNGDGRPDLVIGNSDSTLIFFNNQGSSGDLPDFGPPHMDYQHIRGDVFNTPVLFDLDRDGLLDLIMGNRKGKLVYFRNTGTSTEPVFTFITDSLGRVDVTNYNLSYDGFSTPFFFRDGMQETRLIVGAEEGIIHYYTHIDGNLQGRFTESDSLGVLIGNSSLDIRDGLRTAPTMGHLSDPYFYDLIDGNFSGGLNYYSSKITPGISEKSLLPEYHIRIFPNPANDQVTIGLYPVTGSFPPTPGLPVLRDKLSSRGKGSPAESGLKIYDLLGRTISEFPFSQKTTFSVSAFPEGIYFIRCGNASQKLIIRH